MEDERKQQETEQTTPEAAQDAGQDGVDATPQETGDTKLPEKTEAEKVAEELEAEDIDPEAMPEDLMDMYEESFKQFEEGEVVQGRIISVTGTLFLSTSDTSPKGRFRSGSSRTKTG
jgi:hypothetical protein